MNKKIVGLVVRSSYKVFKSSLNSFSLYPLVNYIWNISYDAVNADNLVKDYFPEPPNPTNNA